MKKFVFISLFAVLAALAVPPNGPGHRNPAFLGAIHAVSGLVSSNSLQSYLKLDDDLNDVFGDSWTDNAISYGAGKINNAVITTREVVDPPEAPKYISHGTNTRFDLTSDWTISLWVYNQNVSVESYILCKTTDPSNNGYTLVQLGGSTFALLTGNSGLSQVGSTNFGITPQDTWCHVVIQNVSGSTIKIKVNDGSWDSAASSTSASNAADIVIGCSFAQDAGLTGMIDGVSIWKRVLTDAEITKLWNLGNKARPQLP